ncbi:MAG: site-specific integrase [Carboxylicivirga sp.]|nr:site-specific integrase [Carboxylicivirga sp.]
MNNISTFGVQFIIRHKSKQSEMAGIYLRITVNKQKIEVSTKLRCPKSLWNQSKEKVMTGSEFNSKHINHLLDNIRARVLSIYQDLRIREQLITPLIIKNQFLGNKESGHTLVKLLDIHYENFSASLDAHTMRHYKSTHRYLKAFLKEEKKVDDIYLQQVDYRFIREYETFLRSWQPLEMGQRKLAHNTVMKHLSRLRTLINFAIKLDWISHYPFKGYKLSYKQGDRKYLSLEELNRIKDKTFFSERMCFIRDIFVFSCYTGLSYSDVARLTEANIVKGIDGVNWIHTQRKKTDTPVRIPLLDIAEQLILKYKDTPKARHLGRLFPIPSNQKLNVYLKEIADVCEIEKNLTFHVARHTFATTVTLANGVPIETVSKILGHTKIATTQIYAKVIENKISEDMNVLRQKLEANKGNKKTGESF